MCIYDGNISIPLDMVCMSFSIEHIVSDTMDVHTFCRAR